MKKEGWSWYGKDMRLELRTVMGEWHERKCRHCEHEYKDSEEPRYLTAKEGQPATTCKNCWHRMYGETLAEKESE